LTVEKISAVTLRVANMRTSVRFYRDVLGLEIIYGGEDADFSSLRTKEGKDPILNLERSNPATLGPADLLHFRRCCVLVVSEGKRLATGEASRRFLGRTVFSCVRSRRPRVIVRASDLTAFQ